MNRMFLSAGVAGDKSAKVLKWRLRAMAWSAVLAVTGWVLSAQAQETSGVSDLIVVDDGRVDGFRLFDQSYVILDGEFEYDPIILYENKRQTNPGLFDDFFDLNPATIGFTMESDYYEAANGFRSTYEDEAARPVSSGPVRPNLFPGSRYKGFRWRYAQENPNPVPGGIARVSASSRVTNQVHRPLVRRIPYYIALELLEKREMFQAEHPALRYFEPTDSNHFMGLQASRVAMDLYEPGYTSDESHIACPVWYEFKFMGYVDGFPNGVTGAEGERMEDLPDGVTFVSEIGGCGEHPGPTDPEPGVTTAGCATINGTKVAVLMDLVRNKRDKIDNKLGAVLLHELLHAYGFGGHAAEPNNVMTRRDPVDAPYLDQAQCEMLYKRKSYRIGFSGFEPWES